MLQADAELMAREIWVAKEEYEETKQIRVPLSEYVYIHLSRQVCFLDFVFWFVVQGECIC